MKEVEELFPNEFVLKITNKINGSTHYVSDVRLETFPADHEEESVKFRIRDYGEKNYKQYIPDAPSRDALNQADGTVIYPRNGYPCLMGDYNYNKQIIKSVGGLIALDLYQMEADDVFCGYFEDLKGSVILDKDLNVVYTNFYKPFSVFYKQEDAYKFLHDFGPEALAFMKPKEFNSSVQQNVKRVFDLRVKHQEEKFIDPAEIAQEKELFNKAFDIMKKEYETIQAKNAGMER